MVDGLTPPSRNTRNDDMERELTNLRDVVRYGIGSAGSTTGGNGFGGQTYEMPSFKGLFAINPTNVEINDIDENGTATGGADERITINSSTMIITHASLTTLNLVWINGTMNNGQFIILRPQTGKTLVLKTGGNINTTVDVNVSDNSFVILQYFNDSNKYNILSATSSGDNLGNHTATTDLDMATNSITDVGSIFFDSGLTYGVAGGSSAGGMDFSIPTSSAFDFFVNNLVTPKFGITETSIESNVPLDMNLNHIIFQGISPPSTVTNEPQLFADSTNSNHLSVKSGSGTVYDLESAGGDNLGNHTATQLLDMSGFSIDNIDDTILSGDLRFVPTTGNESKINIASNSTSMNFFMNGSNYVNFTEDSSDGIVFVKGGNYGGTIKTISTDATPANGAVVGKFVFDAFDSSLSNETFAQIVGRTKVVTNGSEEGSINFELRDGSGANTVSKYHMDPTTLRPSSVTPDVDLGSTLFLWRDIYGQFLHANRIDNLPSVNLYRDDTTVSAGNSLGSINFSGDITGTDNVTQAIITGKNVSVNASTYTSKLDFSVYNSGSPITMSFDGTSGTLDMNNNMITDVSLLGIVDTSGTARGSLSGGSGFIRLSSTINEEIKLSNSITDIVTIGNTSGDEINFFGDLDMNYNIVDNIQNLISGITNPASTGFMRLGNSEQISWRNAGNTADYYIKLDGLNTFEINAPIIPDSGGTLSIGTSSIRFGTGWFTNVDANNLLSCNINASNTLQAPIVTSALNYNTGIRQTFSPNGTNSGFNVGSNSSDPSSPLNGDIIYNTTSNTFRFRQNGSWEELGGGGGGGAQFIQEANFQSQHSNYSMWHIVNMHMWSYNGLGAMTTQNPNTVTRYMYPIFLSETRTLKNVSVYDAVGGSYRVTWGLYNNATNGELYPTSRIWTSGPNFLNFTGHSTAVGSVNQSLTAGIYWLCFQFVSGSGTTIYHGNSDWHNIIGWVQSDSPASTGGVYGWKEANPASSMPTTMTSITDSDISPIKGSDGLIPIIWYRW